MKRRRLGKYQKQTLLTFYGVAATSMVLIWIRMLDVNERSKDQMRRVEKAEMRLT